MHLITDNIQKLFALCQTHKVKKLYAFGSILTPRFNERSDVDLLVDFNTEIDHNNYADNFFNLYHALVSLFGREVDLVDESAIKNPYFKAEFVISLAFHYLCHIVL
ncbi:MAG: nucleotidyltransferase domain-containing protein [Bacteroidales bacterium]|nr:nucleotidyltransferase domain-containing protein [Bacteroidales bacterium]